MQAVINLIPNINIFVYVVSAILLLSTLTNLKLSRAVLFLLTMTSTIALLKINNHLLFITMWVWTSVLLFLTSIQAENNSSRKYHFSQYTTYIIADLIFFFMSIFLEVKFGKLFLILPIIVRCNLIPFQFFAAVGSNKNFKNELQLTTINFLTIFIFLHKFHVDSTLLIKIITVSIFLTSFRFIRNACSANTLNLLYILFANMCVFLALQGFSLFAHSGFIFFLVIFTLLSYLLPKNITENALRHIDCYKITPEKIFPIIVLAATAFVPFSFSSTFYLSVFELVTFKTWYMGQNHYGALILFGLTLWFLVNLHCAFTLIFNLVTHLQSPDTPPSRASRILKFGVLLPLFLFAISSYNFTGYTTFINSSSVIPIQNIKANVEQYLIFFFVPIILFTLIGVFLRKFLDLAKFLLPIYAFIFKAPSLYLIYTKVSFSAIQSFVRRSIHMFDTFLKIVSKIPLSIYTGSINAYEYILSTLKHFMQIIQKGLEYKLVSTVVTDNYHIILIFMALLIIAFSSALAFSTISTILMALTSIVIGYFLSTQNEDPK